MNFPDEKEAESAISELPFCNASFEKPFIKLRNDMDLLGEIPFYNQLNIVKISKAFKGYARSYNIEIID